MLNYLRVTIGDEALGAGARVPAIFAFLLVVNGLA
jgi:hypothetical protein